jgi:hypothetical protein
MLMQTAAIRAKEVCGRQRGGRLLRIPGGGVLHPARPSHWQPHGRPSLRSR